MTRLNELLSCAFLGVALHRTIGDSRSLRVLTHGVLQPHRSAGYLAFFLLIGDGRRAPTLLTTHSLLLTPPRWQSLASQGVSCLDYRDFLEKSVS